jgi:hypothetical protein
VPAISARDKNELNNRLFNSTGPSPTRRIVFGDEEQMLGALVLEHDVVRRVRDHHRVRKRIDHLLIAIPLATHAVVSELGVEMRGDAKENRTGEHHD